MIGTQTVRSFPDGDRPLASTFTLVTWNVQKGRQSALTSELQELVADLEPDLLFLQEARADLLESGPMGACFAESWKYPWPNGTVYGVMTASRKEPAGVRRIQTRGREFGVTAPKVSLATTYCLPNGRMLLTVNVHLLNFELRSLHMLEDQVDDIKRVIREHDGPVVLAGDFNTWNDRREALTMTMAEELGLSEVSCFPEGRKTGDQNHDGLNAFFNINDGIALDRVFFRGLVPGYAKILDYDASDHLPLAVSFEVAPL